MIVATSCVTGLVWHFKIKNNVRKTSIQILKTPFKPLKLKTTTAAEK